MTVDNGKQGRREAVALLPDLSKEGKRGLMCLIHNSNPTTGNFMVYQD